MSDLSLQNDEPQAELLSGRTMLVLAGLAGLAWAIVLTMLFVTGLDRQRALFAPERLLFCVLLLAASVLTFVPLQAHLRLPGLAREGIVGSFLLFYTLAYVPSPRGSLLALPDIPAYVILALALFWFVSAALFPVAVALGQRVFRERARQYDLRRARRQAHIAGATVVGWVLLAGLRVLTPLAAILVVLIAFVAELLFLSFVDAE